VTSRVTGYPKQNFRKNSGGSVLLAKRLKDLKQEKEREGEYCSGWLAITHAHAGLTGNTYMSVVRPRKF
jgi:hypothetical protein